MSKLATSVNWGDVVDFDDDGSTYNLNIQHNNHLSASSSSSSPSSSTPALTGLVMPAVPATMVTKVDAQGVRTVIEYGTNEKGQKLKITKKVRSVQKRVKVNKRVLERQQWAKFGECAGLPRGPEPNVTYTSIEVIHLDLRPKKREEEKEEGGLDKLAGQASIVVCRNCGETGHWTLKCPKRNEMLPPGSSGSMMGLPSSSAESQSSSEDGSKSEQKSKYVPIALRSGGAGRGDRSLSSLSDDCALRVTNISEETTESDLGDLFRKFGHTTRIFLAKDRQTGLSRGFAFVSYARRAEAQAAIDKLNGHGYDNLILHVEWAKPREEKPDSGDRD